MFSEQSLTRIRKGTGTTVKGQIKVLPVFMMDDFYYSFTLCAFSGVTKQGEPPQKKPELSSG